MPETTDPRVVLVTGASSGIGAAVARATVARGGRVGLMARSADRLEAFAAELGGPDHALPLPGDVTSWDDQAGAVGTLVDRYGQLDVVLANAGRGARDSFVGEGEPEGWSSMVATNVLGAAYTVRASLPALRESGGHLVLLGSVAGRILIPGSMYSVTKWAVSAMGHAIRAELQEEGGGVRGTVIEPGKVDTPWFETTPPDSLDVDDVVRAFFFAIDQPPSVDVNEILLRPIDQRR